MSDVSQLLASVVEGEPAYAPDVSGILTAARRRQRTRRLAAIGSGGAVTVGAGALAVVLAVGGSSAPQHRATRANPVGAQPTVHDTVRSSATPDDTPHGITEHNLAALIEQDADVELSGVDVSVLPPAHDIDLAAGISSVHGVGAKDQYLNAQVLPSGTGTTTPPTCADLNGYGDTGDWDMYRGSCQVTFLPDGGYLTVRTARTLDGTYAITQADLVDGDGSGFSLEATNQRNVSPESIRSGKRSRDGAVVSQDPPITAAALADLARQLDSQH